MAVEFFDESQGKPVNELTETTVLDEASVFLTTYQGLTRKINTINLIKAMSGDEGGDNYSVKFYTVGMLDKMFQEIRASIGDNEDLIREFTESMRTIRSEMSFLNLTVESSIARMKEETKAALLELEKEVQRCIDGLSANDALLEQKITDLRNTVDSRYYQLQTDFNSKIDSIIQNIVNTGDITEGLATQLNTQINQLNQTLATAITELTGQDAYILNQLNTMEVTVTAISNKVDEMDAILQQMHDQMTVRVISNEFDENNNKWDLNDFTANSMVFWNRSAYPANLPPNVVNGLCLTINCTNVVKQIFMRFGTAGINEHHTFTRMKVGSSWSDWVRYLTSKDILYGTEVPTSLENGQVYYQYF